MSNSIEAKLQEDLRDALVDYYLGQIVPNSKDFTNLRSTIKNVDDLYDHLLLDTQVSAKVITSRLSLVTQSVQQYINRIALNLEPGLSINQQEATDWEEFANRYGYWAANQQLRMFPEIYVDPTLRLTKTEFFFQLESALNQGKLTDDVAQKAVLGYLNNFEEVSNLEIIAGYQDGIDIENDKTYFVARTRMQPYRYFWRSLDASQRNANSQELYPTAWSEWKAISVPLENVANGIVRPIMMDNRLYISWFEVAEEKETDSDGNIIVSGRYRTKIRLAHLGFDGVWSSGTTLREEVLADQMEEMIAVVDRMEDEPRLALVAFKEMSESWDVVFSYICDSMLIESSNLPTTTHPPKPGDGDKGLSDLDDYGANLVWFYLHETANGGKAEYKQLILYPVIINRDWPIELDKTHQGDFGTVDDFTLNSNYTGDELSLYLQSSSTYKYDFSKSKNIIYGIWKEDANNNRCWLNYKLLTPEDYEPQINATLVMCDKGDVNIITGFSLPNGGVDAGGKIKVTLRVGKKLRDKFQIKQFSQTQYLQFPEASSADVWYIGKQIRLNTLFAKELIGKASRSLDLVLSWETQNSRLEEAILGGAAELIDLDGANGIYFWELFFHMPFMVSWRFNVEQRYEDANRWVKYLFNPFECEDEPALLLGKPPYWNSRPLVDEPFKGYSLTQPSDPDAIAASDPIHYRKAVFNFLTKNIIDQGDMEYRKLQPSARTLARLSYSTASSLLGRRPDVQLTSFWQPLTLEDASYKTDSEIRAIEMQSQPLTFEPVVHDQTMSAVDNDIFMYPMNNELRGLWDRIENRIYNLRHNLTLDGKEINMDLYDSSISPRGLMKQRYQRVVTARNASKMNFKVPNYRFEPMLNRSKSGVETLIQFGSTLLSLLERKDSLSFDAYQMIQSGDLYRFSIDLQKQDIDINKASLEALQVSKQSAQDRYDHFKELYDENISSTEQKVIELQSQAANSLLMAQGMRTAAAALDVIPNIYGLAVGGSHWGAPLNAAAEIIMIKYQADSSKSESLSVSESYRRRRQEWELQYKQAEWEVNSVEQQINLQNMQIKAANKRLEQVEAQQQQAMALLDYFSERFTNESLYTWLISQLSSLYLQAYDAVLSLCLSAEASLLYELNLGEQSFVGGGGWNDLYQGLMAGETLKLALMRMERVYVEQNSRRQEITKTISLKALLGESWPAELNKLKQKTPINFNLEEQIFVEDYQELYQRRIKSVSVSLPMLVGPYEDVCAQLTQTSSSYSTRADLKTVENMLTKRTFADTPHLVRSIQPNQQISLSTGVNDSGLFMLNFDDERFLPFEGSGVDSSWRLQFTNLKQNLDSLNDVILHVKYTAAIGSSTFSQGVRKILANINNDE